MNIFKFSVSVVLFLLISIPNFAQTPCDSPTCSPVPMTDVCADGTNTVTLTCDSGLAGIIWYNSAGTQVGTGCDLNVDNAMVGTGVVGQTECFYYEADDANSCPGESCCPVNVTVLNCMTCSIVGTDPTCNGINDGSATVTPANGVAPYTYSWSNTQFTSTATNLGAGTYTVTVTDAAGGTSICSVTLVQPTSLTCTVATTNTSCFGVSDGSAMLTVVGGAPTYTYNWNNGVTTASNPNLTAGTYTVTVTDANGCMSICSGIVGEPLDLVCSTVIVDPSCNIANGLPDGELNVTMTGGTGGITYAWTTVDGTGLAPTAEDQTGLTAGTYNLVATDANGCTSACVATLSEPIELLCSVTAVDATDCGIDDGSISITASGGTPIYSYSLNGGALQTSNVFTGLSAGTYTLTTTDANGCTVDCTATINVPSAPMCTITSSVDVTCNGGNDGSLVAAGTGGSGTYEYSIDGVTFQTGGTFTNLAAGSYTVTVRSLGNTNCLSSCNIIIVEPLPLTCTTTTTDVSCNGGMDGSATVTAAGGFGPYTYAWNTTPSQTSATATMLPEGAFSVIVTDANGCTTTCNVTIAGPPALQCSLTGTDVTCNGGNDGEITVTASGGSTVYEYSLNGGAYQTSNVFASLTAGSYVVTTIDDNMCMTTCMLTLLEPDVLSCSNNATDATDCAIDDGTISTTAIGGVSPYTYSLNGGTAGATNIFAGLGSGTYTVLVTDSNGCTTECTATINSPLSPMCSITSTVDVTCNGGADGSLTAEGFGGAGSYEYSLGTTMFQAVGTFTDLMAGSYTVTVRNVGNPMCTSTCNVTIVEPAVLACSTTPTDVTCLSGSDGEAVVLPTGGLAPYTYLWDDAAAQTTATAMNLTAGTYNVIVTDANGCMTSCVAEINQPLELTCSLVATDVTCTGASDGSITVTGVEGTMPYDYSLDGGAYQTSSIFSGLGVGSYIVTIRDANLCISNCSIAIVDPQPIVCTVAATDATDCSVDDGSLVISVTGGTPAYEYALNGAAYQAANTFTGLGAGSYMVSVRDANGCLSSCTGMINSPSAPMCSIAPLVDVTCNGLSDGSLTVTGTGGTGTYEYSIDGITFQASTLFSGLAAGNYTITVRNTGQTMCSSTCSAMILEPAVLACTTTINDASCNGATDGDATVIATGGVAPYTYLWDDAAAQTTATANNLAQGSYTVTVTDANNCITTCTAMVMAPATVMCTLAAMDVTCNGGMDGVIVVTGTGGAPTYEYSLDGGVFMAGNVFNNLATGSYVVTIKDANNCMSSCSINITEPTPVMCSATAVDATDCGVDDGMITALGIDGTPGYEYSINGGGYQTSGTFTGLGAGTYTITVRDINNCTSECSVTVNTPSAPMCTITSSVDVSCNSGNDGSFTVSGTGGSGAYEYSIDGTTFTSVTDYVGLIAGSYTVTVRNLGDPMCTSTCNVTISEPALLACVTSGTEVTCNADADGTATVVVTGGTMPYVYLWDDLQTAATATSLAAGTYMVTVTDANSCTIVCDRTVTEPQLLACTLTVVDADCLTGQLGSLTVATTGGVSPLEYSLDGITWQPGNAFSNLAAGMYTVSVRDFNMCITTCTAEIMSAVCDYDLALTKQVVTAGPYTAGQDITYAIMVCNQGTLDANFFEITDHIPAGMMLSTTAGTNAGWVGGPTGSVTYAYNNLLAATDPDACATVNITLTVDPAFMGTSLTNEAEITNDDGDDVDSTPAVDDGPDTDNDMNDGADDEDPETITFGQTYDLALTKQVVTAGPYTAGQDITYAIMVCNQGTLDANFFEITDHIPAGMMLSTTAGTNAGWVGGPTGSVTYAYNNLLAATDPDACATVNITLTVDPAFMGTSLTNEAEITNDDGDDVDSTPAVDDGPDTDNDMNDGADDEDPETITFGQTYDLALTKQVVTAGPYTAGQDITYAIMVCNQGTLDANFFEITDHIPAGMMLSTTAGTNAGWVGGPTGSVTYAYNNLLAATDPDACATVNITLTVDPAFMGTSLTNEAEITNDDGDDVDSTPAVDDGPDTDNDMNDGADDEDPETITFGQTYDLALTKQVVTAGPYTAGQDITYAIMVCNQGTLDANFFEITDHIPAGMMLSTTAGTNAGWVGGPTGSVTYAYNNLLAATDPDACATINITLTIDPTFMGTSLVNNAEITNDDGDDVDSTPAVDDGPDTDDSMTDGADDEDPETITLDQTYDLAMTKQVITAGPYTAGQDVTYAIMVCNQGTLDANFFEITDHIPTGMMLSTTAGTNAGWVGGPTGSVTYAYNNLLAATDPDACATINVTLTIDPTFMGTSLVNNAEITNDDGDDVDSTPAVDDGPDTDDSMTDGADDEDPETITLDQTYDLAMTKQVITAGPYTAGQDVTYAIMVCNQGTLDANFFEITDHIPAGMMLSTTAGTNAGWVGGPTGSVTYAYNNLLAATDPDACATINITLTIDPTFMGTSLVNNAEITNDDGGDVDSTPAVDDGPDTDDSMTDGADDEDPETITLGQTYDLAMTKQVITAGPYTAGQDVTYAIMVCNQGTLDANFFEITDHIPAGMMLSTTAGTNAGWVGGPTGSVTYAYNNLLAATDPDACATINITLTIDPTFMGTSLVNNAEITNDDGDDVDSTPAVDDGPDTDNDMNDGADDEDLETITLNQTFDLALIKELDPTQSGTVAPGDQVAFTITVVNQGTLGADNIEITDYIPTGFTFNTLSNPTWIDNLNGTTTTTLSVANGGLAAGGLAPMAMTTITIFLDVAHNAPQGAMLTNWAEISAVTDTNGGAVTDIDSTPDNDQTNDTFGGDNETNNGAGDEDDHDPESVTISMFDLALIKTLAVGQSPVVSPGDLITYTITVTNQGDIAADNIEVADYIPTCMSLADANWIGVNPAFYTLSVANNDIAAGGLLPNSSVSVDITLMLDAAATNACDMTNWSEIASSTNANGDPIPDGDSTADIDPLNDGYGGTDLTDNSGGDEDDHDDATVNFMAVCDLALVKEASTFVSNGDGTGGQVTYTLTVYNQGGCDAYNVQLTDYIPADMMLNDAAWTMTNGYAYHTIPGPILSGANASVDINLNVTAFDPANPVDNYAEVVSSQNSDGTPQMDMDSTPDDDPTNDGIVIDGEINNNGNDEDDHDVETLEIMDLAIEKTIVTPGPYSFGQVIEYSICVVNEGNMVAQNIQISDNLPTGMTYAASSNLGWTGTAPTLWYTFAGPLNPNQSACTSLFLTLDPNPTAVSDYVNVSEITSMEDEVGGIPQDWDSSVANDNGDQSEDDEDSVGLDIYDLALTKAFASYIDVNGNSVMNQGDDVIYTITVYNQGTIDANNIQITDYLPAGMSLSSADANNWVGTGTTVTNTVPFLAAMTSTTLDIQVSIASSFMGTSLDNWAEISSDDGDDADSTPDTDQTNDTFVGDDDITGTGGDEDDHDIANIALQQYFDLALTKEFVSSVDHDMSGTINHNDDVLYTITVYNQGTLDGTNIEITDYIPTGMTLSINDTNNWIGGPTGSVTNTIASVPAGGAPVTVDILLTVDPTFMGVYLTNWAEISNDNNGGDVDSTPDGTQFNGTGETDDLAEDNIIDNMNGDEDDHDPAQIMVGQVFDLALMKMVAPGQAGMFNVFDDITYTITLYNQGTLDAYNINVIDYVQPGHIISPNDTNGWTTDATGNYTNVIAGPLTPGTSTTVDIVMRVTQDAYLLQLDSLTNIAEITGSEDVFGVPQDDMDSTADSTVGNDSQMDDVTNGSGGDEDDEDPAFAMLEPLDPLGYVYCEKTGQVVTGGLVTITGPGNITYGMDTDGSPLDGRSGLYQFFVDVGGIYNITYTHPSGIPLSTTCLPMPATFDPTNLDGTAIDRDGIVNNQLVLGFDTINGGLIDYTCAGNPYFMSVDIQPADPPIINMNNIPVSCSVIASTICEDADLDGQAGATDPGFDGVMVSLFDCNNLTTPIATQVTSNGGQYDFGGLSAGCYRLYFDLPAGFAVLGGGNVVNDNGWTNDINVNWGECYADATFCLTQANAGLGDRVWHDTNGDGIQTPGEPGIADVKVYLYSDNGFILDFTFTDANGNYLFDELRPGHNYVKFVDPEGYSLTSPNSGNNDNEDSDVDHSNGPGTTSSTWLDPAELDLSMDAGYYNCVPVGDYVWMDVNNNNTQDNNENGINGVRVNLYRVVNGIGYLFDYTYTGHKPDTGSDDGYWKFCAPPGDYYVHFDVPSSLTAVNAGGGNSETDSNVTGVFGANTTASFTIVSGDHRCDIDGGYRYSGLASGDIVAFSTGNDKGVSLSDLSGKNAGQSNQLSWTAFEEELVEYYSIQRMSTEGQYETIGRMLTIGADLSPSEYIYEDYGHTEGLNQYRVVAFDETNKAILKLDSQINVRELKSSEVKLYPSITTSYANLKITTSDDAVLLVDLVSLDGSTFMNSLVKTSLKAGSSIFRINTEGLAPGIYYLRVQLDNELTTKKLIVIKE